MNNTETLATLHRTLYEEKKHNKNDQLGPTNTNWVWTHVLTEGKQFLFQIRHPSYYSYSLLGEKGEKTNLRKKEKIQILFSLI